MRGTRATQLLKAGGVGFKYFFVTMPFRRGYHPGFKNKSPPMSAHLAGFLNSHSIEP